MNPLRHGYFFAGMVCFFTLFAAACARHAPQGVENSRLLPRSWKIAVAPFTQPLTPAQLITGSIPSVQGSIDERELLTLDSDLRQILQADTGRAYEFLPPDQLPADWKSGKSSGQPSALGRWLKYGREHGVEWLLVPQVLDWHEREGSEAGVTRSAHARLEFFLLDVGRGQVVNRSIFEEKQVGLIDNLLDVGKFVRRGGQWISSADLAREAMKKAVQELGL